MSCSNSTEDVQVEKENLITTEIITRDLGESCFEDGLVDDQNEEIFYCNSDGYQTINVNFPQYPGCTFVLGISYTQCIFFNGGSIIYLKNISMLSHDCTAYNNDVIQAEQNETLTLFSLQFNKMMFDAATDHLGQWAISNGGFTQTVIKYNTASCVQFCYHTNVKNGVEYYTVSRSNCGIGCCAILVEFYEMQGVLVSTVINLTEDIDDCIATPTTSFHCRASAEFGTECTFTCDSYL